MAAPLGPVTPGPPDPIDAELAERVLRRASELVPAHPEVVTPGTGLSEQVLIEAAAEVGIPADAVRRALAIERLGPTPSSARGDRLLGPATIHADTATEWSVDDTLRVLDGWLVGDHHLRRDTARPDGGEWSMRRDTAARVLRGVRSLSGEGRLGKVPVVRASAQPLPTGTVLRVQVDRTTGRAAARSAGITTGVAVAGGVAAAALVVDPAVLVAAPLAAVAGLAVSASGGRRARQIRHELDRLLDRVRRGERPPGVAAALRRRR
jgi:hypothetical protein